MLDAIAAGLHIDTIDRAELIDYFENEIANLDKKAERARSATARKTDDLKEVIKSILTSDYQSIADVLSQIEGEEITASKVIYRLNALVEEGFAEKADARLEAGPNIIKVYRRRN